MAAGSLLTVQSLSRAGTSWGKDHLLVTRALPLPCTERISVTWEDRYSEELGSANFLPMSLDIVDNAAYVITTPMGCLSYKKWGRPNPPYVIFQYWEKDWQRIPLENLPAEITAPNLIRSAPDYEVERSGKRFFSAEMIKDINSKDKRPEHQVIVREFVKPVIGSLVTCEAMIHYKCGWIRPNSEFGQRFMDMTCK
ncbi:hypothetical protein GCM10027343_31910 [Noviherbaspirillum agri]